MQTATDAIKTRDGERRKMVFENMIEAFSQQYCPQDRYDAAKFEAQLFSIARQIYEDAQAPLLKHITEMATYIATPTFPTKLEMK